MDAAPNASVMLRRFVTRHLRYAALHGVLPVLLGGALYLAFRSTDHLLFRWAAWLGAGDAVRALRVFAAPFAPGSSWLLYSLPDGLWLYAFVAWMNATWPGPDIEARLWRALPLALAFGSELAQRAGMLEGTFDVGDLIAYWAAAFCASLAARMHVTALASAPPACAQVGARFVPRREAA